MPLSSARVSIIGTDLPRVLFPHVDSTGSLMPHPQLGWEMNFVSENLLFLCFHG